MWRPEPSGRKGREGTIKKKMHTPKVVTFGEIMLRLSPPGYERFLQSPVLGATFGGGEANVAVSLALFGLDSYYVTRLPAHDIGEAAVRALRAEGVKTDFIIRCGDRIGVYFVEAGASQRASVHTPVNPEPPAAQCTVAGDPGDAQ